jgi:hypothetical protein
MEKFKTETRIYKIIPPEELYRPWRPEYDNSMNFMISEEIYKKLMMLLKDL